MESTTRSDIPNAAGADRRNDGSSRTMSPRRCSRQTDRASLDEEVFGDMACGHHSHRSLRNRCISRDNVDVIVANQGSAAAVPRRLVQASLDGSLPSVLLLRPRWRSASAIMACRSLISSLQRGVLRQQPRVPMIGRWGSYPRRSTTHGGAFAPLLQSW